MTSSLTLPWVLTSSYEAVAADLLRLYVWGDDARGWLPHEGAAFESIGHHWDDIATQHVVTPADIVALTTLAVDVPPRAAIALLGEQAKEVSALLKDIPTDLDLVDAPHEVTGKGSAVLNLWTLLRAHEGMGPTRVSKLLARKRSRLLPVYDSIVAPQYGLAGPDGLWDGMRSILAADGRAVHERALRLRDAAALPPIYSPLRIIDIVTWMHGKYPAQSAEFCARHGLAVQPTSS